MLAKDEADHVLRINMAEIAEHFIEPRCIQQCTGSEDPVHRIIVFFLEMICQNIERVGDDDNDRFLRVTRNAGHHAVTDFDVLQKKRVAVMVPRLDRRTCCNYNHMCVRAVAVIAYADAGIRTVRESCCVACVQHFSKRLVFIPVDNNDVIEKIHLQYGIQYGIPDLAGADNHKFPLRYGHFRYLLSYNDFIIIIQAYNDN